jgi:signal transduction histidine kinase
MESTGPEGFVYAAAHDLREPLRTVKNFARLLGRTAEGKLDEAERQYLGFVIDGVDRMQALVDGMMALATADRTLEWRTVECGSVLRESLSGIEGVDVECGELPEVRGDPVQVAQVFRNLLSNSMRFRRPDVPLKIRISAERVGPDWRFCVRDNGSGFDSALAEAAFEPFRRLHGRSVSGSGLGLAICRKIVESHGGRIWAEAEPGAAAFWFTLPASEKS